MRELLTIDQAAEILGIKPWTLRSWISQKRISYIKLGRLVRLDPKVIEDLIRQNTIDAVSADRLMM